MKLKKILKESNAPGYKDRKFGEGLPTLASVQAAYEAKQAGKKESLKEEYIEIMDGLTQGLSLIKDAWTDWKTGPMTERDDIKPAQKELMKYVTDWMKKNIK
jgi:hypothetical protein